LRPQAREKLARIGGILVNYPKLRIEAEAHTDNMGSAEYNLKLSEQRAYEVRRAVQCDAVDRKGSPRRSRRTTPPRDGGRTGGLNSSFQGR
jgi:outer membrane protein OmpA-like peptidoglycan-associated protein